MATLAALFDLDGTLVQTREASWKIFARTNAAFRLGIDSQEQYFQLLEENLFAGLRKVCRDEAKASEVARHFLAQLDADYVPDFRPRNGRCCAGPRGELLARRRFFEFDRDYPTSHDASRHRALLFACLRRRCGA